MYWNYIKGLILIGLVVFLFGFAHTKNSDAKVVDLGIEFTNGDNLFMNYEMVNKLLIQNNSTVKNQAKSVIDLHKLEAEVQGHPMVEQASVFLTVNGLLKTKIKQRTPIARVITNYKSYYIDTEAKNMPLSVNHSARVMLISGDVKEEDSKEIHFLVRTIMDDEFFNSLVIGIRKTIKNEFILKTRLTALEIELGETNRLSSKLKNLKAFYKKAVGDGTIEMYKTINLRFDNQVVCTKL